MNIRQTGLIAVVVTTMAVVGVGAYAHADQADRAAMTVDAKPVTEDDPGADAVDTLDTETTEPARPTADHDCGETGEYQEEVEELLVELGEYGEVFVDGEQSVEDCAAITKFQSRFGIEPVAGYAGEVTVGVARRLAASDLSECDSSGGLTACVDLTNQTMWVADSGVIVMEPTVVRTGYAGFATEPGMHEVQNKAETEWSVPYEVWLPYWQRFYGGQGFHETTTYLHDAWNGSHGCVNLLHDDAVRLYELIDVGTPVHVFGHREGT